MGNWYGNLLCLYDISLCNLFVCGCSSMEVGVCAEAYQGAGALRHINSAFMTFEVLDKDRKPRTLPRIRPEPVVSSADDLRRTGCGVCVWETACKRACVCVLWRSMYIEKCHMVVEFVMLRDACLCSSNVGAELWKPISLVYLIVRMGRDAIRRLLLGRRSVWIGEEMNIFTVLFPISISFCPYSRWAPP